jgi:hypothetical protein
VPFIGPHRACELSVNPSASLLPATGLTGKVLVSLAMILLI